MNKLCLTLAMLAIVTPAAAQQTAKAPLPARPFLPPPEYSGEYKGQVIVTKWHDYSLLRALCKNPTTTACAFHIADKDGGPVSCLIMLGPRHWNDERALKHELGHCNGWPGDHPGAIP